MTGARRFQTPDFLQEKTEKTESIFFSVSSVVPVKRFGFSPSALGNPRLNHVGRPLFPLLLLFLLLAQVVRLLFERARPLLLD